MSPTEREIVRALEKQASIGHLDEVDSAWSAPSGNIYEIKVRRVHEKSDR